MKTSLRLIVLLCAGLTAPLHAIVNGDFEAGDLSGWTVTLNSTLSPLPIAVTVTSGPAPFTNNNLNEVYSGTYACKLDSGQGYGSHAEYARISQNQFITAGNTILEFYYAAVLDGAHATTPSDDAYMAVEILNGLTPIVTKSYYYASSPAPLVDDGVYQKRHLPWTQILVDLSAYNGLTVTVQFTAYDCNYGGHNSIAYVDGFHFVPPTPTITPTFTNSPSFTITPSFSYSPTPTESATITQTFTHTPTPSITESFTATPTRTITCSHTFTPTATPTPTITPTFTLTPRPLKLKLLPPSPNPTTKDYVWIPYYISVASDVDIDIYSVAGEHVRHLDKEWCQEGYAERKWELRNDSNQKVATGTYIYRVRASSARGESENDFSKCAVIR